MKSKITINICLLYMLSMLYCGCKREDRIDHIDGAAPAPEQVSNISVTPVAGGALLSYKLPKDPSLSYIKAVYEIRPGVFREAKSSYYKDTLSLVGYGDTLSHNVKVYSVGKNEKLSNPVSVTVIPLSPPIKTVFQALNLTAVFGGVKVTFKNKTQANLAIDLLIDSTGTGTWAPLNTFYSAAADGAFSVRGLASQEKKFAVCLRDRWNNKSDTLYKTLTPYFEELISKAKFSILRLPTDIFTPAEPVFSLNKIYDGKIGWDGLWASANSSKIPQWFTLDMGQTVLLSRFKEHQLPDTHLYQGSALKTFEVWGSNDPNPDGSWASWQLMGTFHSFKPSGLPLGQINQDDYNYGYLNGEDFDFDNVNTPYRYLRIKALESYSSSGQIVITEMTFWGQVKN